MATEDLIQQLPVLISRDARSGTFSIAAKIHLDKLHLSGVLLNVGVGAVLQTKDEQLSHWALVHPKPRPDFHNRASFVLEL